MVRNRAEPIIGPGPATEGPVDVRLLKEQVAELQAHNSLFLAKIEQLERDNQVLRDRIEELATHFVWE
ncbi:MAG: hypothetical protein ACXVBB_20385 [Isosphaeraceae bacterium]